MPGTSRYVYCWISCDSNNERDRRGHNHIIVDNVGSKWISHRISHLRPRLDVRLPREIYNLKINQR